MGNFEFIGGYDRRTVTGTIAAADAHKMVKASRTPKRQSPPKPTWENCQALAKRLNVSLAGDHVWFGASSFESGKMYGFKNAPQAYGALLQLQRDRLAKLSDEQAIADGIAAKESII